MCIIHPKDAITDGLWGDRGPLAAEPGRGAFIAVLALPDNGKAAPIAVAGKRTVLANALVSQYRSWTSIPG